MTHPINSRSICDPLRLATSRPPSSSLIRNRRSSYFSILATWERFTMWPRWIRMNSFGFNRSWTSPREASEEKVAPGLPGRRPLMWRRSERSDRREWERCRLAVGQRGERRR